MRTFFSCLTGGSVCRCGPWTSWTMTFRPWLWRDVPWERWDIRVNGWGHVWARRMWPVWPCSLKTLADNGAFGLIHLKWVKSKPGFGFSGQAALYFVTLGIWVIWINAWWIAHREPKQEITGKLKKKKWISCFDGRVNLCWHCFSEM